MEKRFDITRTVEATRVTALVFDKIIAEARNETITVSGKYTIDDTKLEKICQKRLTTDTVKFIEVVDVSDASKVYGITLEQFLTNAVELDPKTRTPISE